MSIRPDRQGHSRNISVDREGDCPVETNEPCVDNTVKDIRRLLGQKPGFVVLDVAL